MTIPISIAIFIYLFLIILCAVAATLYVSRIISRKEPVSIAISVMMIALLFYTVFELVLSLFDYSMISLGTYIVFVVISDIAFLAFVSSWLSATILLTGNPYLVRPKIVVLITVIYAAIIEPLGIIKPLSNPVFLVNAIFDGMIIVLSIILLIYGMIGMKEQKNRFWVIGFSSMQILYMLYIIWWDMNGRSYEGNDISRYQDQFDPICTGYVVLCLITIWLLWKKGNTAIGFSILDTIGITDNNVDYWDKMSAKYKLTMREVEVSQLVCKGLSNPDIAKDLLISENTVKHHLNSIYKKTETKNRYELIHLLGSGKN